MAYWHIQMMYPHGPDEVKIDSSLMLKEPVPVIGTGEWPDSQCYNFKNLGNAGLKIGDIILVREGNRPLALCKVKGESFISQDLTEKHLNKNFREVEILDWYKGSGKFPKTMGTLERLTLRPTKSRRFIENWLVKIIKNKQMQEYTDLLKHKCQIVLQGPPGTGKTYTAKDIAEEMIEGSISPTKEAQQKKLDDSGRYKLIQFHPAYSYEDFVRGITVEANGSNVNYKAENRVLGAFAVEAANSDKNFVLVIDEINRANLPAVLGELIYALEYRGHAVESMYKVDGGDNKLLLPQNLYIIGTMNTADRSVGHIDYAIRRRFAFKSILPDKELVHDKAKKLFEDVSKLFIANYSNNSPKTEKPERSSYLAQDFAPEDVWLGHSYFMVKKTNENGEAIDETEALRRLDLKLKYEIKPLLREYVKDGILLEKSELMKPDGKSKWTVKEYIENLQVS